MSEFCQALSEVLTEKGSNPTQYSRLLNHKTSGLVFQVLQGTKPVPLDELDEWLNALQLPPQQRRRLEVLAYKEFAPPYVWKLLNEFRVRNRLWYEVIVKAAGSKGIKITPPPEFLEDYQHERKPQLPKRAR